MPDVTLPAGAWTLAAVDFTTAVVAVPSNARVRAYLGDIEPAPEVSGALDFPVRGLLVARGMDMFTRLWLRSDTEAETRITINTWPDMGTETALPAPSVRPAKGPVAAVYVHDPKEVNGGTATTDFSGLPVIDCGGAAGPTNNIFSGGSA